MPASMPSAWGQFTVLAMQVLIHCTVPGCAAQVLGLARLTSAGAEWLAGRPAAVATRNEHPGTETPCAAEGCQRPAVFQQ